MSEISVVDVSNVSTVSTVNNNDYSNNTKIKTEYKIDKVKKIKSNVKKNMVHISFKNSPYELKLYNDIMKYSERLGQSSWCKDVIAEKLYGGLDLDSKITQEVCNKKKDAEQVNLNETTTNNSNSNSNSSNINQGILQSFQPKSFM